MFPKENFEVLGISVNSGVSDQPNSNKETLDGALGRAINAMKNFPGGNYYVGIEGGVEARGNEMESFAWVVVKSGNLVGKGKTGTFFLPDKVIYWVKQGKELGEADDIVFKKSNSKQKNGAIGILTGNVIDRKEFYKSAVITALIPFKNKKLYKNTAKKTCVA